MEAQNDRGISMPNNYMAELVANERTIPGTTYMGYPHIYKIATRTINSALDPMKRIAQTVPPVPTPAPPKGVFVAEGEFQPSLPGLKQSLE